MFIYCILHCLQQGRQFTQVVAIPSAISVKEDRKLTVLFCRRISTRQPTENPNWTAWNMTVFFAPGVADRYACFLCHLISIWRSNASKKPIRINE